MPNTLLFSPREHQNSALLNRLQKKEKWITDSPLCCECGALVLFPGYCSGIFLTHRCPSQGAGFSSAAPGRQWQEQPTWDLLGLFSSCHTGLQVLFFKMQPAISIEMEIAIRGTKSQFCVNPNDLPQQKSIHIMGRGGGVIVALFYLHRVC